MSSMYALFDDAGKFHAGRVMTEAEASMQVELDSGRRVKVKAANVMLRFDRPAPAELLARAQTLAAEIDLDLAWEFAPEGEFGFADLARDYFSASAGPEQQAAALLRLFDAPHYFRRMGRGQFRKAPEETVKAQAAPLALLVRAGAITSPYQFHWRRFLFDMFPAGTGFPAHAEQDPPPPAEDLPLAAVRAFSIDDSATTEIDDALSVQGLGTGTVVLGIHIAAPGLAITPDSALDRVARERLSTVYMPGWKITMLPDAVVRAYTLTEGRDCPALSIYVTFDEATLEQRGFESRAERVPIVANLRHDKLDAVITEDALEGRTPADFPFAAELAFGWRLARHLKAAREAVRGRPEVFTRPDYGFRLERDAAEDGGTDAEPDGSERVRITPRRRGAPLDLIVAEAMILANSRWGGWLAELGVPAIYRSQASLAPGIKVRMGTKPLPHAGMGVPQYAWSTSPLRRYVDLVNQWQILACVRHGRTAALAAPFKPRDSALLSVVSAFDAAYSAYGDFQNAIERFWTLRWLEQNGVGELDATVIRPGPAPLLRAETLPLVFALAGAESLERGARVRVRIARVDLLTLDLHAALQERLPEVPAAAAGEPEDEAADVGPLHLAIEVDDAAPPGGTSDASADATD